MVTSDGRHALPMYPKPGVGFVSFSRATCTTDFVSVRGKGDLAGSIRTGRKATSDLENVFQQYRISSSIILTTALFDSLPRRAGSSSGKGTRVHVPYVLRCFEGQRDARVLEELFGGQFVFSFKACVQFVHGCLDFSRRQNGGLGVAKV